MASRSGLPSLPTEYHDLASDVAKEVLDTYPYKRIVGLPDLNDFNYSMLYRVTPPTWLSDAAIRACCLRLASDYPSCRLAGFLSAKPRKQRARNNEDNTVNPETRDKILDLVGQGGVTTVFLPLNFSNAHWCCVVIKVDSKRIYYYDPLNQGAYMNAANAIYTHLKISGLQNFDVIPQNNPIQFDAYSCGVYVCWMFIRQIIAGRPVDMSTTALTIRRFERFFYLLTGLLLPVQAAAAAEAKEDGP